MASRPGPETLSNINGKECLQFTFLFGILRLLPRCCKGLSSSPHAAHAHAWSMEGTTKGKGGGELARRLFLKQGFHMIHAPVTQNELGM